MRPQPPITSGNNRPNADILFNPELVELRQVGVAFNLLSRRVRGAATGFRESISWNRKLALEELARLKRELARVTKERDF